MDPDLALQRRIGAVVLLGLTVLLVVLQVRRAGQHGGLSLDRGYQELGKILEDKPEARQGHAVKAADLFRDAVGQVVIDAEAVAALTIVEELPTHLGLPPPAEPTPSTADESTAITYVQALLVRGMPAQALTFCQQAHLNRGRGPGLDVLAHVATRWLAAVHRP